MQSLISQGFDSQKHCQRLVQWILCEYINIEASRLQLERLRHTEAVIRRSVTCKPRKYLIIAFNYVTMLSNYVWHPQKSVEILECFIVSSVAKDCLVLSQHDPHHSTLILLVTSVDMSSYKSTMI